MNCMSFGGGCDHIRGFPFAIYSTHYPTAMPYPRPTTTSYNPSFIILDIIFWYLISCLIIFSYSKFKIKK